MIFSCKYIFTDLPLYINLLNYILLFKRYFLLPSSYPFFLYFCTSIVFMEFQVHTLNNGIRIVHKLTDSPVAHCGILINTGSRDESASEHGMAHLIEHLLFKGTLKRRAYHVLSRMEDVGSEINAYTTKEDTCVHASFFNNYYERALELISDIVFHSVFPEREIEKEKEVIIDEINSYKDSPSELIFDDFEESVFLGNPIGRNILGEEKLLRSFSREKIMDFYRNNYFTNEMVIASVGNIAFHKLVRLCEKHFAAVLAKINSVERKYDNLYKPFEKTVEKKTHQAHCIIGNIAYDTKNEKRYPLYLLNNLLGGPGLNSRLNMSMREKGGFAYNVDSTYSAYTDTGILNIYFGTDSVNLSKSIKTVMKELENLKSVPLSKAQLMKAKKQLIGQIAIASQNDENLMLSIGKSILVLDRIDTLGEITEKINAITELQVQESANEIFKKEEISCLVYL
jgi:predicted Zn-dependent peptidase